VRFKLVNRQAESVFSALRPKGLGQPRWRRSLRWRSGELRCHKKQSNAKPFKVASELNNMSIHNVERKLPSPMLLKAHATPVLPRCPASAAPLVSNARPTLEICALPVAVGACEVVGAQVAEACVVVEEGDADD
jgi:hypothetical protein